MKKYLQLGWQREKTKIPPHNGIAESTLQAQEKTQVIKAGIELVLSIPGGFQQGYQFLEFDTEGICSSLSATSIHEF